MDTRKEVLEYGLSFPDTYQDAPFHDDNWQLVRYKGNKKAFLWTYERDGFINLNVKVDPDMAYFWRSAYESVIPGYHQNKDHWNTVILDGSIPDEDVKLMIEQSYELISDSPTKRIYEAVKKIPYGYTRSYEDIALELTGGNKTEARKLTRAVGHACSENPVPIIIPCHRVIGKDGKLVGFTGGVEFKDFLLTHELFAALPLA